jgi:hypothetical protein
VNRTDKEGDYCPRLVAEQIGPTHASAVGGRVGPKRDGVSESDFLILPYGR